MLVHLPVSPVGPGLKIWNLADDFSAKNDVNCVALAA